jgi:glyoxylase-like metal-dependent hydrolase (beta-lactamase superfamily II)
VGGLTTAEGTLAFPNAAIHISAPEWVAMQANAGEAALVKAIGPKVAAFQPGAELIPGVVKAVEVKGHTPGHSAYEIASGGERLLYIGDAAHHFVISVAKPDWTIDYDGDPKTAQASRRALFQKAADENLRLYAGHFPYPGLGRVKAQGDGFVWVPEAP